MFTVGSVLCNFSQTIQTSQKCVSCALELQSAYSVLILSHQSVYSVASSFNWFDCVRVFNQLKVRCMFNLANFWLLQTKDGINPPPPDPSSLSKYTVRVWLILFKCELYLNEEAKTVQAVKWSIKMTLCHICNKSFTRRTDLRKHIKNVHEKRNVVSCSVCSKTMTKGYVKEHMIRQHSESNRVIEEEEEKKHRKKNHQLYKARYLQKNVKLVN